jgi:hypothetical protein
MLAMMNHRRNSLAAQRFTDRRQREGDAPKLSAQVPGLSSLKLEVEEQFGAGAIRHTRRIVVDNAPALFLVPCGDPRCVNGEHDLTTQVMSALRAGQTSFKGQDECTGTLGSSVCLRVLRFGGNAEYLRAGNKTGEQDGHRRADGPSSQT